VLYFVIYLVNYNWNFELLWGQNCQFVCLTLQNPPIWGNFKIGQMKPFKTPQNLSLFFKNSQTRVYLSISLSFPSPPLQNPTRKQSLKQEMETKPTRERCAYTCSTFHHLGFTSTTLKKIEKSSFILQGQLCEKKEEHTPTDARRILSTLFLTLSLTLD